jgi:hypothetical protein
MAAITVRNIKTGGKGVYIGRKCFGYPGSPLMNPFPLRTETERPGVITRYRAHLLAKIAAGDPPIVAELRRLHALFRAGEDVALVCWCSPRACHGDVVKEVLEGIDAGHFPTLQ